jgi:survival motor neuron protein
MSGKGENLLSKDDVWDDSELIKMYDNSVKGIYSTNKKTIADEKTRQWKVGDACMAPFGELWYQAKVLSVQAKEKTATVHFLDYGDEDDATVELNQLFAESEVQFQDEEETEDIEMSASEQASVSKSAPPQFSMPIPKMIPPPPSLLQPLTNEKEITNNLMISWYMSGYHTGYFQAMRDFQQKASQSQKR